MGSARHGVVARAVVSVGLVCAVSDCGNRPTVADDRRTRGIAEGRALGANRLPATPVGTRAHDRRDLLRGALRDYPGRRGGECGTDWPIGCVGKTRSVLPYQPYGGPSVPLRGAMAMPARLRAAARRARAAQPARSCSFLLRSGSL